MLTKFTPKGDADFNSLSHVIIGMSNLSRLRPDVAAR